MEIKQEMHEEMKMYDEFYLFKKVSLLEKSNFFEYVSVMLEWWVSLNETLSSVSNKLKNVYFINKIGELKMYIWSWDSFSKSMKKIPWIFSQPEVATVEAWEATWTLSIVLAKLSEELKKVHNLTLKVKAALTYPAIIFLFLIIAVVIVLTYVIPNIVPVFTTSWVELPLATKALISTSDFLRNNFFLLAFFIIWLVLLLLYYKNTREWRLVMWNLMLSTPIIWIVYRNYILSSFSSNFGSLLWAWIPVVKSLNLVSKSINNTIYQDLLLAIAEKVSKWNKITDSMVEVDKKWKYFPIDFIQLFSVWERTASLEQISKKISDQYTREVDYSLTTLTKWIEPIAILMAWTFVVWFAFAIFWAILKVTQTVG